MSIITNKPDNEETKHYHIFFVFHLRSHDRPIAYTKMFWTSKQALHSDIDHIQLIFETLQTACQNKINFTIRHALTTEENPHDIEPYKDMTLINGSIEEMVAIIQKELETNAYDDLPSPALARKENHLVIGMYANKDIKFNVVDNHDIMSNYIYNTLFRFGRLIYTDGIRTYNGCIKEEYLSEYDEIAERFFEGYGCSMSLSIPTKPYQ